METNWAEENLKTIRTLMERSAVYRRALAPVMLFVGFVGIVGGIIGWWSRITSGWGFISFWSAVAVVAVVGTFILVRRQAFKDSEPLWSPPMKRVTQALIPPFTIGAFVAVMTAYGASDVDSNLFLVPIWSWAFGCAICSTGFFVPRGMRLFGWIFILIGFCWFIILMIRFELFTGFSHLLMGGTFGGLHLAYGIYLYFTEKKHPIA